MAKLVTTPNVRFIIDDVTRTLFYGLLRCAEQAGRSELTITSAADGVHNAPTMPHAAGHALDVRSHDFADAEAKANFVLLLQDCLGPHYYVFLEDAGTANEHFHLQVRNADARPAGSASPPTVNA